MKTKRALSILLTIILLLGLLPTAALAASAGFSDTKGHWAAEAIETWSRRGVIDGEAGEFRPDDPIKRGDVAIILSRLFGYTQTADNSFSDVSGDAYYASAVLQARAAGSMVGSGTRFNPDAYLTRQEAAVLLCNIAGFQGEDDCIAAFQDDASIASWARGSVYALANRGFMSGYDGCLSPLSNITRAEFATLLDSTIAEVADSGTVTDDVYGTLVVTKSGVTLSDMSVVGDLIIAEGVGEGTVTLDNVSVSGKTIIRGGGMQAIDMKGKTLLSGVSIEKNGSPVHILASEDAFLQNVAISGSAGVALSGNYGSVSINSSAQVNLVSASVKNLVRTASGLVSVDGNSYVENAAVSASNVQVVGVGMVSKLLVQGNDALVLTSKTAVTVAAGVTGTTVTGQSVAGGESVTSPDNTETVNGTYTYTDTIIIERQPPLLPPPTQEPQDITVYVTVEAFTIGMSNYIVAPTKVENVPEGINAAEVVTDLLGDNGYGYTGTGSVSGGFYLAHVTGVHNLPANADSMQLPDCLSGLPSPITWNNPPTTKNTGMDSLGEFDYTFMSGWMYSVNNVFPNVGMSEYALADGDVIRLEFTLWGYGADIGGGYAAGGYANYYPTPDLTDEIRDAADSGNYTSVRDIARQVSAN